MGNNVSLQNKLDPLTKKDYFFSFTIGTLIGFLSLPILKAAQPNIYAKIKLFVFPFFFLATPFGLAVFYIIGHRVAIIWQLGKFGVTGVLNVLVDFGVLLLLIFSSQFYFAIDPRATIFPAIYFFTFYSIFKSVSFIIANINSYYWNKYWTFSQQGRFIQFFVVSMVGFLVNVLIASLVFKSISGFSIDQAGLIGAIAGSIAGLIWNFLGYKFIVFKKIA